jgi:ABC-type Na+ efflux pump permease subunit
MNQGFTPRAVSFAIAALLTVSMLAGIDALAGSQPSAQALLARAAAAAAGS